MERGTLPRAVAGTGTGPVLEQGPGSKESARPGGLGQASQQPQPQGAWGSAAGALRRCARGGWLRVPCGFLPGQTRLRSPGRLSPPPSPSGQHSHWPIVLPAGSSPAFAPHPCPPPATLAHGRSVHAEPIWGSVHSQSRGAQQVTFPILRACLQAGTQTKYGRKASQWTKIFNRFVIRILFFFLPTQLLSRSRSRKQVEEDWL